MTTNGLLSLPVWPLPWGAAAVTLAAWRTAPTTQPHGVCELGQAPLWKVYPVGRCGAPDDISGA
jgi:hypothetical protein